MKTTKKLLAILLSVVMMLAMGVTAFAATNGTITIDNANIGETYKVYKVFNASGNGTSISYTLVDGKTDVPDGFSVDTAGNVSYSGDEDADLTADDIAAIAAYVVNDNPVAEKTAESKTVEFTDLPNGYYYITTTTGTLVTVTSTNPNATVQDKNEAPELDKKVTAIDDIELDEESQKALAQVGSVVTYTATIDVKEGAKNYIFHDTMSNGLSYNNDLLVKVGETVVTDYTTPASNDTITIKFDDTWIATQAGKTITITYTATVTSAALTSDPATNKASLSYGNDQSIDAKDGEVEIYNAKISVTKVDGNEKALAGAGFVLKNSEGNYYKLENNVVSWVANIADATELTTATDNNVVVFTGLADDTYTLIENTVPAGYNKAEDQKITIVAGEYTTANLEKSATVVNMAGSTLPSTGGTGTTIFYVLGAILVLGAGVVLVSRRRMSAEK